jgi:hypothetical protein
MKASRGIPIAVNMATASRFVVIPLLFLLFCGSGIRADAASAAGTEFGSPPSGEVPILYNDQTVYAKPDILKRGRVLGALVKDGHVYVPLRSMFEQMGATVSISADGKTITASKTGVNVSVTLDKNEVVINGESRALDVPPMLYEGVVLVPMRVLSEALGAYVQWVPERRVVVVRYIPPPVAVPTAPPTPMPIAPTAAPTVPPIVVAPLPTPEPTVPPVQVVNHGFVQAAFTHVKNYNEFSAGEFCPTSYLVNGAYTFNGSKFAVKIDYRFDSYVTSDNLTDNLGNHYTRYATIDGAVAFRPVFLARQTSLDARLEYQIAAPQVYVGVGYLTASNNYGYPQLSALGAGIEKLPDLRSGFRPYGSAFYYPSASGNYTVNTAGSPNLGKTYQLQYSIVKYDLGVALLFANSPLYIHGGFAGDRYFMKQNAPIGQVHEGPYLGLGLKL